VIVPGGFGTRGIEGKVAAANHCRTSGTPYLGISIGLHTAVIEFARNQLGWEGANSTEFNELTQHPVVVCGPESSAILGSSATIIQDTESLSYRLYGGSPVVYERHRHRYEVNPQCISALEQHGLNFAGKNDRGQRMELCELRGHPFFIACQFHPEFKSRPAKPGPLFVGLLLTARGKLEERLAANGGKLKCGTGFDNAVG